MSGHIPDSANVEWCTPPDIMDRVYKALSGAKLGCDLELDPCSNNNSIIKAKVKYQLPEKDGLVESWDYKSIFVNPPFGRSYMNLLTKEIIAQKKYQELSKLEKINYKCSTIKDWIKRCKDAFVNHGSEVIALVPVSVDTSHWQEIIFPSYSSICFIKGRVKFLGAKQCAPMAVSLVYWGNFKYVFYNVMRDLGFVI